jgi:hypothetical protein
MPALEERPDPLHELPKSSNGVKFLFVTIVGDMVKLAGTTPVCKLGYEKKITL